jgi:arsenate reductase
MTQASKVVIYEKPTCSKCRELKRVLTEKGIDFETVNYIENPLSAAGLKQLLHQAGLKPHEILRTKEDSYRTHVAGKNLTDDQLISLMAQHPELIQRPIVVRGDKAVLARDVEKLKELGIK